MEKSKKYVIVREDDYADRHPYTKESYNSKGEARDARVNEIHPDFRHLYRVVPEEKHLSAKK